MAHVLEREQLIPRPRPEVFRFFSDAANRQRRTPDLLREYRLRSFGVPFRWTTRIEERQPGERFVDQQLSGPYRRWWHVHTFEDRPGGTLMRDRVDDELPLGPLGTIARGLFVARQLDTIFAHRRRVITQVFA